MRKFRIKTLCVFLFFILTINLYAQIDGLKLHYSFENTSGNIILDDSGNNYNGTILNSAYIEKFGDFNILNLGYENGYLDMGAETGELIAQLEDFTVSTYLFIDANSGITGNGNFVWAFSTHQDCNQTKGKYIAYRVNLQRYALSIGGWGNEKDGLQIGTSADKGQWHHIIYSQSGGVGSIYIDGELVKTGNTNYTPKNDVGNTTYNWLGRPQFTSDSYLKGASYTDFRIYDRALTSSEIQEFKDKLDLLKEEIYAIDVEDAKNLLQLNGLDVIRTDLHLPISIGDNVNISWTSSNSEIIANNGLIYRPNTNDEPVTVTLTATLTKKGKTATKEFQATVLPKLSAKNSVKYDLDNISIDTDKCYFLETIKLPTKGVEGTQISWKSNDTNYITDDGEIIKLPQDSYDNIITLTATAQNGSYTEEKEFQICLQKDENFTGYLFAYFTGNDVSQEQIFFALSNDGYNYLSLNNGNPVISGSAISDKGGVRDPHILRSHDGKYYMVVTDMKSSQGWTSNHGIILLKSDDLTTWTHSKIDLKAEYPEFSNINRAWAPQVIYDEKVSKYMVYFSMKTNLSGSIDIIYYAYTNAEFTELESAPKQLFYHPDNQSCIDGDIIYKDGKYHLFFKTEGSGNGIKKAVSGNLTSGYVLQDKYLQQTTESVEGSCVFKIINKEKYILMYDVYMAGQYQFTESSDLENFTIVPQTVSMNFAPRHGTVISITTEEAERLIAKWGNTSMIAFGTSLSTDIKTNNIVIDETSKSVLLPVKYGTDLTKLNPKITGKTPGISVSPSGTQDFSNGPVNYTLSLGSNSVQYSVSATTHNNPVISSGYFADPEIIYSEKDNKFYLYPTSDGYPNWSGNYMKAFSSTDLVNWKDEGVIIDARTEQVSWANSNTWAPAVIEKKIDDRYKYFYYFSGAMNGGSKKIGVAVSNEPTGPFYVSAEPLIVDSPTGSGQQIDPAIFTDPVSNKSYIYWGNGYLAVAELNEDMLSLKTAPQVITPANFTEGIYVFYRDGKYYFLWSEGNTGNKNYKVRYATANSPTGPLIVASNNIILELDESNKIYGTGHNSVIQNPETDEWYIVYHRISRPNGIDMSSPGDYREVCIDKLEFNPDGTIKKVVPTLEGINPIELNPSTNIINQSKESDEIKIYPTVVKDIITIEQNGEKGIANISFYDISGRLIMQKQLPANQKTIDCSSLPTGWVFVETVINGKIFVNKLFKM